MSHPLHLEVGNHLQEVRLPAKCRLHLAPECGGSHNLPLFCSKRKSNDTEYCNVDALLVRAGEVRVVLEIEESGLTPTKLCGKFLTSALSTHFIHDVLKNAATPLASEAAFVQIMDAQRLPPYTKKTMQAQAIEHSIQSVLPLGRIAIYRLFVLRGVHEFKSNEKVKADLQRVFLASCG